jgi:hypothetical protein
MALKGRVLSLQVWVVAKIVSYALGFSQNVVNQSWGYLLLSNVFAIPIF